MNQLVSFFKLPDADAGQSVRNIAQQVYERNGKVVYTGKIHLVLLKSKQADFPEWDAIMLTKWGGNEDMESMVKWMDEEANILSPWHVGMQGFRFLSLLRKAMRLIKLRNRFGNSILPFQKADSKDYEGDGPKTLKQLKNCREIVQKLEALSADGVGDDDKVFILNLITTHPDPEAAKANSKYVLAMLKLFAEANCGPRYLGPANKVSEGATFERVALVEYPSAKFFKDMISSTYMAKIARDKQLGDTFVLYTTALQVEGL